MGLKSFARFAGRLAASYVLARDAVVAVAEGVPAKGEFEPIDPATAYEPSDIHTGPVMLTGFALLAGLAIITGLLYFVFAYFVHREAALSPPPLPANVHGSRMPPEPRIQAEPAMDLHEIRAHEDRVLNTYHWLDRSAGRVSIPIDRAMQLIATEGVQPESGAAFTYYDPQAGSQRTGLESRVGK